MLTEPALAKYKQAVHKLQPLIAQLPQDCERENGLTSLKDMATRIDAIPVVKVGTQGSGHDLAQVSRVHVVGVSERHGGFGSAAARRQIAARVKMANVNFYRACSRADKTRRADHTGGLR